MLRIKSSLARNLLEPKLYKLAEHDAKKVNPFADTQLSVGKYITDSLLFKYAVFVKEDADFAKLYYEQRFGFEWRIFRSLVFMRIIQSVPAPVMNTP